MDFKFHKKEWASISEKRLPWALLYEDHLFSFWKDAITSSALLQPKLHRSLPTATWSCVPWGCLLYRLCQAPCPATPCVHPRPETGGLRASSVPGVNSAGTMVL